MFLRHKKGQSILEYAVLLGVVIAALLVMQIFIKRGYMGGLKDSADKMGEAFSAGGTTIHETRSMTGDQHIFDETGTTATIQNFLPEDTETKGTVVSGTYTYNERSGSTQSVETQKATDTAAAEKTRWDEYQKDEVTDFTLDNPI